MYKTVKARFWPWLELFSGESLKNHLNCPLLARQQSRELASYKATPDGEGLKSDCHP